MSNEDDDLSSSYENFNEVWDVEENNFINDNLNEEKVKTAKEDVEIYEEGNPSSLGLCAANNGCSVSISSDI